MTRSRLPLLAVPAVAVMLVTCRNPTQITIEVRTDFPCADLRGVEISIGTLGDELEHRAAPTTTSVFCRDNYAGSLVVVPGPGNADVGIKVVAGFVTKNADQCRPSSASPPEYGTGCIVARRALAYLPHTPLAVPIVLHKACDGVPCNVTSTCVGGVCVPAPIPDPNACARPGGCPEPSADGGASSSGCQGTSGPAMVRLDVASPKYSFCIDTTEVTNADFNRFLAAPGVLRVPPACSALTASKLPGAVVDPRAARKPVTKVSFCDAWAYCAWAGKRLCGKVGGGAAEQNGAATNEWVYACESASSSAYPYGATYDPSACNTEGDASLGLALLVDVDTKPGCHGVGPGFSRVFHMSGNAAEFDSYLGVAPVDDAGTLEVESRGGAVSEGSLSRCGYTGTSGQLTRDSSFYLGFRCCADIAP